MKDTIIALLSENDEKFWAVYIIGVLKALEDNIITIVDAEKSIFSPYMAELFKQVGYDNIFVEIIWHGCELENIASIIPAKLKNKIRTMIMEMENWLENKDKSRERWIKEIKRREF